MQTNLFGEPLQICSTSPITGCYRDGTCRTSIEDGGSHSVCAVVTDEFLGYSKAMGNDLTTPIPQYGFTGLKDGDRWCLCAARWYEAYKAGYAPKIDPSATSSQATKIVDKEILLKYAI
jgi:uncharacterized protein (DUF2237 family)